MHVALCVCGTVCVWHYNAILSQILLTFSVCLIFPHNNTGIGQELFYSCPAVRADTAGICIHGCSLNSDCTHSKKCCYNGCGHTCQSPVPIPYVRLSETTSCPSTNEVPCVDQEGGGSCHDPSFSCDEGEICCDNDCASAVCLSLSDLKPCITAKKVRVCVCVCVELLYSCTCKM